MDRLGQLAQAAPRAGLALPLVLVEAALVLAVLGLLGPTIFLPSREPFNRLMEFIDVVFGRSARRDSRPRARSARREPPVAG